MMKRSHLFALLILLLAPAAQAYIPPYWMILSRTAQNHGKGAYIVDQDVTFSAVAPPGPSGAAANAPANVASSASAPANPTSSLMTHEHWTILNEPNMRL